MTTTWSETPVAHSFEAYQDIPEQLLGYSFVFQGLPLHAAKPSRILDYGCGPGKVALRLAEKGPVSIIAVDQSPAMLELARAKRPHPSILYRLVHDDTLDFVNDNTLDGAMACYVFINTSSEERIHKIMREIFRALKPGASFMILDTNPSSTGIEFSTFRNGVPGKTYGYGEDRQEWLHVPGQADFIIHDYHWPPHMYQTALRQAGFEQIEQYEPTLQDISKEALEAFEREHGQWNWQGELTSPPFLIFRATKG